MLLVSLWKQLNYPPSLAHLNDTVATVRLALVADFFIFFLDNYYSDHGCSVVAAAAAGRFVRWRGRRGELYIATGIISNLADRAVLNLLFVSAMARKH